MSFFKKIAFPPFYFFSCIILILFFYLIIPKNNLLFFPYNIAGILIMFIGLFIIIKCTKYFNKNDTTLQNKQPTCFIKFGFYKYSRNPMYLGGLLFLFGLSIILANSISFTIPFLYFFIINYICIPVEEQLMKERFMNEFIEYKKKVRRWI